AQARAFARRGCGQAVRGREPTGFYEGPRALRDWPRHRIQRNDGSRRDSSVRGLQIQALQVFAHRPAEVVPLEREFHGRLQETEFVSRVITAAIIHVSVHFFALEQGAQAVGELEFSASAGRDVTQGVEDGRGKNVAADDGEV